MRRLPMRLRAALEAAAAADAAAADASLEAAAAAAADSCELRGPLWCRRSYQFDGADKELFVPPPCATRRAVHAGRS
jgi:hypothetical protein